MDIQFFIYYYRHNTMASIEELSRQLAQSHFFKDIIQEQVRDCLSELTRPKQETDMTLNSLIQEIGGHLSCITELALEEQTSQKYANLMDRNEDMYLELQKKMERETATIFSTLSKQIEEIRAQMYQLQNSLKNSSPLSHTSKLKTQRRAITRVILETSKFMGSSKTKSTIDPRRMRNRIDQSGLEVDQNNEGGNSRFSQELDGSTLPLSSQKANSIRAELMKEILLLKREQQNSNEGIKEFISRWQSKLQMNLQGIWNVISDLTNRLSRFEPLQSVIGMCDDE